MGQQKRAKKLFYIFICFSFLLIAALYSLNSFLFSSLTLYLYIASVGFCYWAIVAPNHDTDLAE